jgi:hypothetical protein
MSDKRKSGGTGRNTSVQNNGPKRGGKGKAHRDSAQARSAAARKAVRTRARRAKALKTLKTGEESFSLKEYGELITRRRD